VSILNVGKKCSDKNERRLTMTSKYFDAECTKCGWALVVPIDDKNDEGYYLCQTCAFAKIGA
jgi:hypothetical protein